MYAFVSTYNGYMYTGTYVYIMFTVPRDVKIISICLLYVLRLWTIPRTPEERLFIGLYGVVYFLWIYLGMLKRGYFEKTRIIVKFTLRSN